MRAPSPAKQGCCCWPPLFGGAAAGCLRHRAQARKKAPPVHVPKGPPPAPSPVAKTGRPRVRTGARHWPGSRNRERGGYYQERRVRATIRRPNLDQVAGRRRAPTIRWLPLFRTARMSCSENLYGPITDNKPFTADRYWQLVRQEEFHGQPHLVG